MFSFQAGKLAIPHDGIFYLKTEQFEDVFSIVDRHVHPHCKLIMTHMCTALCIAALCRPARQTACSSAASPMALSSTPASVLRLRFDATCLTATVSLSSLDSEHAVEQDYGHDRRHACAR